MLSKGLAKPKTQRIQQPSAFLMKHLELFASGNGPIADVACGYGRNAKVLASLGCEVHCLDSNVDALALIAAMEQAKMSPVQIDLACHPWPYAPQSLEAVINIHYYQADLIEHFLEALRSGGLVLIETIDARKGNYLQLPKQGVIHSLVSEQCEIIEFLEKKAEPEAYGTAALKLLARKL
jgi:2-polyprenyl-3-methyl-5-hydroxy-6-metoxy-1,4-benzoquinol methylase